VLISRFVLQIRLQTIPQHRSTLCYVPFPGLCNYPNDSGMLNTLFPHKLSPFAKFIITYPDEIFQASNPSSEIIDSPLFKAIIKFKWRAYARNRFFVIFSSYLFYFVLFSATVATHNSSLRIICTIFGTFLTLCISRYAIILSWNSVGIRMVSPTVFLTFGVVVLPAVSCFLDLFLEESKPLMILRASSIGILWIGIIQFLVAFRRIGLFIIGKDFSKNFFT
jgi:hypothetical protein